MILLGETEAGNAGTQPCRGISRWAHRDDERGRESAFLRRPTSIGSKDPHALKIPARRAEYSLTENVASPFQAEPRHYDSACFIMSDREGGLKGRYTEPAADLAFTAFVASLVGKATEYAKSKQLGR